MKTIFVAVSATSLLLAGCSQGPRSTTGLMTPERVGKNCPPGKERTWQCRTALAQFKSEQCAGGNFRETLGLTRNIAASGSVTKGDTATASGPGLKIEGEYRLATELARIVFELGDKEKAEFLSSALECTRDVMSDETLTASSSEVVGANDIWTTETFRAEDQYIAAPTGKSGNWAFYPVCVNIPANAKMELDTLKFNVIGGVPAGSWGGWRGEIGYSDYNEYGPTKACLTFAHQIHDQQRSLAGIVYYKLPK